MAPVIAAIAALAAAWIAAGSTGLLAHPLRRALTLVILGIAIFAPRPFRWRGRKGLFALLAATALAACMIASPLMAINVMSVPLVLAFLALTFRGQARKMLCIVSVAVVVFGLYRMACTSVPLIWSMADVLGRAIGSAGGLIGHQSMYVGATFAGIDFLVLMSVLWLLWMASGPVFSKKMTIYGFAAILGGHLCYLIVLSYVPQLLAAVAEPAEQTAWAWTVLFHKAVPWNLPLLACVIHLLIASAMFRWPAWTVENRRNYARTPVSYTRKQRILRYGVPALAMLLPLIIAIHPGKPDLQGKKIVFCEKGFLNWLKPKHGQYGRL